MVFFDLGLDMRMSTFPQYIKQARDMASNELSTVE